MPNSSNRFKPLFDKADFEIANKYGLMFAAKLQQAFPAVQISQNSTQASTEVFDGSPGFEDECDLWLTVNNVRIDFEITGDVRYELKGSKIFLFNRFSINKLLKRPNGYAVYYLAKENPPMFFLKKASIIAEKFVPQKTFRTVRGDTGIKYRVPVAEWVPFDSFVEKMADKLK